MRTLVRLAAITVVAVLGALLPTVARASAATPIPHVVGPLPVTAASHPFGGAAWQLQPQDLARARLRRGGVPGQRQGQRVRLGAGNKAVVRTAGVPYTTRVIVRRPIKRDAA